MLVARAFIGQPNGLQVNHKDGDKANNSLENLEYVTASENLKHAARTGLAFSGDKNMHAKLSQEQVDEIRRAYSAKEYNQSELGRMYGIVSSQISEIVRGLSWSNTFQPIGG